MLQFPHYERARFILSIKDLHETAIAARDRDRTGRHEQKEMDTSVLKVQQSALAGAGTNNRAPPHLSRQESIALRRFAFAG